MAIGVTGSASSGRTSGTNSTLTVSHTANGDDLFVWIGIYNNLTDWPTCTYGGTAMDRLFRDRNASGAGVFLFRMTAAPAGTANVTVTFPGGYFMTVGCFNVHDAAGVRATIGGNATSTTPSITVPSAAGDLVIDFCQSDAGNQDWTAGAGQTLIYEQVDATGNQKSAASWEGATGATTTMSHTLAVNNGWTLFGCSLAPVGGATTVVTGTSRARVQRGM